MIEYYLPQKWCYCNMQLVVILNVSNKVFVLSLNNSGL